MVRDRAIAPDHRKPRRTYAWCSAQQKLIGKPSQSRERVGVNDGRSTEHETSGLSGRGRRGYGEPGAAQTLDGGYAQPPEVEAGVLDRRAVAVRVVPQLRSNATTTFDDG